MNRVFSRLLIGALGRIDSDSYALKQGKRQERSTIVFATMHATLSHSDAKRHRTRHLGALTARFPHLRWPESARFVPIPAPAARR